MFRWYAKKYGVNLEELRMPLVEHASLGAFFVRRLKSGARVFPADPRVLPSPCDGTLQSMGPIAEGTLLQAKGRPYAVDELLGEAGAGAAFEGGFAYTIYLSPRDYHRVHAPLAGELWRARWLDGTRFSVAPRVLLARAKVLSVNERAVLSFRGPGGAWALVMVGALNVGKIRVIGIDPSPRVELEPPRSFARGDELARFMLGSTVVLLVSRGGPAPVEGLAPGRTLRMGEAIGRIPGGGA